MVDALKQINSKSNTQPQQNQKVFSLSYPVFLILLILIALLLGFTFSQFFFSPKIAYINTGKLMIGFSEANKIEQSLKAEDDKWQTQYKQMQDSIQASIDRMSKEYNKATPAKKKELQDQLSARNQQLNNFRQANMRKLEDLRQKKMQGVYDKANVYMSEYGKKHHYSMIFGTIAGGSILYGNESKYDITDDVIKGLNERYK
ncbi:MAG: OmpH family outer membrane protein [Chitinivibrionales bacterium]|nr:OmpH family outer membrane protein [Chitinivibrionales bacterium]